MNRSVQAYLLSVASIGILLTLIQAFVAKKTMRQVITLVGGLLMILTVLSPLVKLDYKNLAKSISKLQIETEELRTGITIGNREIMGDIIKVNTQAYILDKAKELGMMLEVEVTVAADVDYPYPTAVVLRGAFTETKKAWLTQHISENLGIPKERQEWIAM